MSYVLVQNDQVISTNVPSIGTLPDGSKVSNFDKLDPETLKSCGWLPLVESDVPPYDPSAQGVIQTYEIEEDQVVVVYSVYDFPTNEPNPSSFDAQEFVERVSALEEEIQGMKSRASSVSVPPGTDADKVRNAIVDPQ